MQDLAKHVFVVSDLHIGGSYPDKREHRGFRINTRVSSFVSYLCDLREFAVSSQIPAELVINGDFVDLLAEEHAGANPWRPFIDNQDEAVAVLDRIVLRDKAAFDALNELTFAGVSLTILIGNHDVELSFPLVRAKLASHIAPKATAAFRYIYDGEAYSIGEALIEHGNRYDGFNTIDHDRLRRMRSEFSRRLPISKEAAFNPPPGSRLVSEIINPLKTEFQFVDLLKPETETVIPLLLVLNPNYRSKLTAIAHSVVRFAQSLRNEPRAPARPANPGDIHSRANEAALPLASDATAAKDPLQQVLAPRVPAAQLQDLFAYLRETEPAARGEISSSVPARVSTLARLLAPNIGKTRFRALLSALRSLEADKTFDREREAGRNYLNAATEISRRGFKLTVFGHTHLPKNIRLSTGASYMNSGSWVDFMKVPPAIIDGSDEQAHLALNQFLTDVSANQLSPYIHFNPTYVHFGLNSAGKLQFAELRDYQEGSEVGRHQ